jgi:hypothetical protein
MAARTFVVGDVHGCLGELEALLATLAPAPGDRVVFVGDLVGKGPDSLGVLRLARRIGARSVLGNHDAALLQTRDAASGAPAGMRALAAQLREDDWAWLEALPRWIELPEHQALVVHAGLVPGVPLERQDPQHLLTMRSICPDGRASPRIEDGVPWASVWVGPPHVYFGHDAVRGLQQHPHATGLDTGCVYGGRLTACVLPDRALVSVPAARTWSPPGGNRQDHGSGEART